MKRLGFIIFLTVFVLISACLKSDLVDRSVYDYLQLDVGNEWIYLDQNGDTVTIRVTDLTYIASDSAYVLDEDGFLRYWAVHQGQIFELSKFVAYPEGDEMVIEERYALLMETPFVLGNEWHEFWSTTRHYRDQIFAYSHEVSGKVSSLIDVLETPAGKFEDVYQVEVVDIFRLNDSTWVDTTIMFFAPETGMVKRIMEGDTLELLDFVEGSAK